MGFPDILNEKKTPKMKHTKRQTLRYFPRTLVKEGLQRMPGMKAALSSK